MFSFNRAAIGYTDDNTSDDGLQKALWFLEDEIGAGGLDGKALSFLGHVGYDPDSGWASNSLIGNGIWDTNVAAMNLSGPEDYNGTGLYRQTLLVAQVPEPSTLLLGAALLSMVGIVRRKKR